MRERDVFDLLLVIAVAIAAYVRTFGLADPIATSDEILRLLAELDARIYLVVGGVLGVFFVSYLVVYRPGRDAARSTR